MPLWSDIHFWRPPEDPERSPFPYTSVFIVTITEHVPPRPFGLPSVYPFIEPPYDTSDEHLKTFTQTELVVSCPPLEADDDTDSAVPKKPAEATLKVERPIAVEDGRGPQLVACTVTPQKTASACATSAI